MSWQWVSGSFSRSAIHLEPCFWSLIVFPLHQMLPCCIKKPHQNLRNKKKIIWYSPDDDKKLSCYYEGRHKFFFRIDLSIGNFLSMLGWRTEEVLIRRGNPQGVVSHPFPSIRFPQPHLGEHHFLASPCRTVALRARVHSASCVHWAANNSELGWAAFWPMWQPSNLLCPLHFSSASGALRCAVLHASTAADVCDGTAGGQSR